MTLATYQNFVRNRQPRIYCAGSRAQTVSAGANLGRATRPAGGCLPGEAACPEPAANGVRLQFGRSELPGSRNAPRWQPEFVGKA